MNGELESIPIVVPIAFILSIIKIILFKLQGLEKKEEEKYSILKILKEYIIVEIIILFVMVEYLLKSDFFIDNYIQDIVGIAIWTLIVIKLLIFIKIIYKNFILLVKQGKKKVWWAIHVVPIILSFIEPTILPPLIIILGLGSAYIYILGSIAMNIYIIYVFKIKKLLM